MGGTHHNCDEKKSLEKHGNAHRVGGKQRILFLVLTAELFLKKICNFLGTKASSDICDHLSTIYSAPIYHLASYHPVIAMATTTTEGRCFDIQNQASSSWNLSPEVSKCRACSWALS